VLADLPADTTISCLDAGCGEGYYMRQLAAAVGMNKRWHCWGWIFPNGPCCRRRNRTGAQLGGGQQRQLPVLPGTLDRVLCLFGFPVYAEFARC